MDGGRNCTYEDGMDEEQWTERGGRRPGVKCAVEWRALGGEAHPGMAGGEIGGDSELWDPLEARGMEEESGIPQP